MNNYQLNFRKSIGLSLAVISVLLAWIIINSNITKASEYSNVVDVSYDLTESSSTIKTLQEKSETIAKVKILSTKSFKYGEVVFTLSRAQINEKFKGNTVEKEITILESAGEYEGLKYLAEGNEAFKKGDEAVVFLYPYKGPVAEDAYVIKGVYEGKFRLKDDKLIPSKNVKGDLVKLETLSDFKAKLSK